MEIYCVGGAVRDRLLERVIEDKDYVVVGASPEELLSQGFKSVGKDFPVFLHPKTREEYALARTERKTGPGYSGFTFHAEPNVTLEEDLKRRDLTINAMAQTMDGRLIDPYGGYQDLQKRILRHVSLAFAEDPVRILRVARFMARFAYLGFEVAEDTLELMRTMVLQGEVDALVPERVWKEFSSALKESHPGEFLKTLHACQALDRICPELALFFNNPIKRGKGIILPLRTLACATKLSQKPQVRFAALMQNIETDAAFTQVKKVKQRWNLPGDYYDLLVLSIHYHEKVHTIQTLSPEQILRLFKKLDPFRRYERFLDFLAVCEAIWHSQHQNSFSTYSQKPWILSAYEVISDNVIIQAVQEQKLTGIQFADALDQLRIKVLEQYIKNAEQVPHENALE